MVRLSLVLALASCSFPTPSSDYACDVDSDCEQGRTCSATKFCVVGEGVDAAVGGGSDAADASTDADPFEAQRTACLAAGYTVEAATGGLYRSAATASWTAGERTCEQDVVGATHLIVLSSPTEVAFAKTKPSWVGYADGGTTTYTSVTTEPFVTPVPWLAGQPDNGSGNENCAQMKPGGMDDDQCSGSHAVLCECDGKPPLAPIP